MRHHHRSSGVRALAQFASVAAALLAAHGFADVPDGLENIVFGDEKRPSIEMEVNGIRFEALTSFSDAPSLLWPVIAAQGMEFPTDPAAVGGWLNRASEQLGFSGFDARFVEKFAWRTNDVWRYDLVRNGHVLHDARIEIHWDGRRFMGIANHNVGPVSGVEDGDPAKLAGEWVYFPVRNGDDSYRIVPAPVTRTNLGGRTEVVITPPGASPLTIWEPSRAPAPRYRQYFSFREYAIPVGVFPDQISVDEDGIVWLSQPNSNFVTSFHPVTETFEQFPTTGGSGPDGLICGTQGRVWTGLYFAGGLGVLDTNTEVFRNFPAPYSNAAMAIPVETTDGSVWVTDHAVNRISEFDSVSRTWLQSIIMPTPSCWVVQGYEDRDHGFVYFTEYNANKLGRIALGGTSVTDINVQPGGPAFCVYLDNKVYYSRWNEAGIGTYDVNTHVVTEYNFPVANETGGPMWITPDGKIATGTRNRGYIMLFDPATQIFSAFQIPTVGPGLKDGLTVGPDGTIWFTESGANKLGRLRFRP